MLSGFDLAYLDRLASIQASEGKNKSKDAFTTYAVSQGWGNTPAWVEGRDFYNAAWRRYRASYLASIQDMKKGA